MRFFQTLKNVNFMDKYGEKGLREGAGMGGECCCLLLSNSFFDCGGTNFILIKQCKRPIIFFPC